MKEVVAVLLGLVALSGAAYPGPYYWGWPYGGQPLYNPYFAGYGYYGYVPGYYNHPQRLAFYGKFSGTCDGALDGLYYIDDRSFAFCSNGQKTIQPCAEGSANPPATSFKKGDYYGFYDFCSVNLVANGYEGYPSAPTHRPTGYSGGNDASRR